eukprot:4520231-Alexandrium_andersonii.AAC.1
MGPGTSECSRVQAMAARFKLRPGNKARDEVGPLGPRGWPVVRVSQFCGDRAQRSCPGRQMARSQQVSVQVRLDPCENLARVARRRPGSLPALDSSLRGDRCKQSCPENDAEVQCWDMGQHPRNTNMVLAVGAANVCAVLTAIVDKLPTATA